MSSPAPQRRWWIWLPLLALALWLALFGDKTPTGTLARAPNSRPNFKPDPSLRVQSQVPPPTRSQGPLDALVERDLLILRRPSNSNHPPDLFARLSWSPPPPPVTAQPMPPVVAPTAPALPFTFIGKKLDDGVWEVYLAQGEKSYVLREGSLIDSTYRIEKIAPPNLSLTYLPLGQTQNLPIGESP